MIGQSNYFGFRFTTLYRKPVYVTTAIVCFLESTWRFDVILGCVGIHMNNGQRKIQSKEHMLRDCSQNRVKDCFLCFILFCVLPLFRLESNSSSLFCLKFCDLSMFWFTIRVSVILSFPIHICSGFGRYSKITRTSTSGELNDSRDNLFES